MSAAPQSGLAPQTAETIKRLGIIAGGGKLPLRLVRACEETGIEIFIIAFDGQTDLALLKGRPHIITRLGAPGTIIRALKNHGIRDIVMIGSIRRPTFAELRPDLRALGIVLRNKLLQRGVGDDALLRVLRAEFERDGLRFHGVQRFVSSLLAAPGFMGRHRPDTKDKASINRGLSAARLLGEQDIGQAVIVQEGIVLGVEGVEGTDELIRRCAAYKRKGRAPILIKLCKPQQDTALDLPTIGPDTISLCAHAGMAGIVIMAERTLVLDADDMAALADSKGLFIWVMTAEEISHGA